MLAISFISCISIVSNPTPTRASGLVVLGNMPFMKVLAFSTADEKIISPPALLVSALNQYCHIS